MTKHWDDINYSVTIKINDYYIDFKVYQISAAEIKSATEYHERGWPKGYDFTTNIEEADVYMSGSIKWDGCSNIKFDEQDRVMLHFCGKKAAINTGELLSRLYDLALETIPNADAELFD